jgi:hypothetical protein
MNKSERIKKTLKLISETKNKLTTLKSSSRKLNFKTLSFILVGNLVAFVILPFFGMNVSFLGTIVGGFAIGAASAFFIGSIFKDINEDKAFGATSKVLKNIDFKLNHDVNMDLFQLVSEKSNMGCFKNKKYFDKHYNDMIYILDEYSYALNEEKIKEEILLNEKESLSSNKYNNKNFKVLSMSFE